MRLNPHFLAALAFFAAGCGDTRSRPEVDAGPAPHEPPRVAGCDVFPADDPWNTPIDDAEVDVDYTARFRRYLAARGEPKLHPDFGGNLEGEPYGLPINVVPRSQPLGGIAFEYDTAPTDKGPWPLPMPSQVRLSGGKDKSDDEPRFLLVQEGTCLLFEAWNCHVEAGFQCGTGARFDLALSSEAQRIQEGQRYESSDASGLPVLAGLVRYDEAEAGAIQHALRIGLDCVSDRFVAPATHQGRTPERCENDPNLLPVGLRLRLPADYDLSGLMGPARTIAEAMQRYGLIVSFNGSDLFIEGEEEGRWNDEALSGLKMIAGSALEVIGPVELVP